MSNEIKEILVSGYDLSGSEASLLVKNIRQLSKQERRFFFQRIKPREDEIKLFLREKYRASDQEEKERWVKATVESMMARRGDPDLLDGMVMDVIGRLEIYKLLREQAESRGIKLTALANFGGLSMVLYIVVITAALVLYFLHR